MRTVFELTPFTYLLATEFAIDITNDFVLSEDDQIYIHTVLDKCKLEDRLLPAKEDQTN